MDTQFQVNNYIHFEIILYKELKSRSNQILQTIDMSVYTKSNLYLIIRGYNSIMKNIAD